MLSIKSSGRLKQILKQYSVLTKIVSSSAFLIAILPLSALNAAEIPTITSYEPQISETTDAGGFKHPGIGLTKPVLQNLRAQIEAQQEPWYSYYLAMLESPSAGLTVTASNQSTADPTVPKSIAFNSQGFNAMFIADGLKAYTQAILYYVTGEQAYRANAMAIIRLWSQMDPVQYEYFQDAHIHTGIPLNRMITAAEILRYTSTTNPDLEWSAADTTAFTNNLINPVIATFQYTNDEFMNQHLYPLMGAMAGYIFTGNQARFAEAVEWMTVNQTANNQGFNGSIKRLFRLVDKNANTGQTLTTPVVQHVEMGRDQAHGGGDLNNSAIIARMFLAQDAKVDPIDGTLSTGSDAVGIYEFLDNRILAAGDYFWRYMLGYQTDWVPTPFSIFNDGTVAGIYQRLSGQYRGRLLTANFWDLYYYYTYQTNVDLSQQAPYLFEAFVNRVPSLHYHAGGLQNAWDNVDGGGDFWLYIPSAAVNEGATYLPKAQTDDALVEIEQRYTQFDANSSTVTESNTAYVHVNTTPAGSKIAVVNLTYPSNSLIGIKFRSFGSAKLAISTDLDKTPYQQIYLPDTAGQWQYATYEIGNWGNYALVYLSLSGDGSVVDIDHFNIKAEQTLSPMTFNSIEHSNQYVTVANTLVNLDFSATDSSAGDVLTYRIENLPSGATFDSATGQFSWTPINPGETDFIVIASDGTSINAQPVSFNVTANRNQAVTTVVASYDENAIYTKTSLENFQTLHDATLAIIDSATDLEFSEQLVTLANAVNALKLVSPLLSDGSLDFSNIVESSFGSSIAVLTDGDNDTFGGFLRGENLFHTLDFGVDYKISAESFGIQSRLHFVDRGAGITVYASNDTLNWVRLTPGESEFKDAMSILAVDPQFNGQKFRYIKFEMINPQPDALRNNILNIMELGELRIFGQRFETENKLASVEMSSPAADETNFVTLGSEVTVSITAKEIVSNMKVTIQGVEAVVSSEDGINWTATATLNQVSQYGYAVISVEYDTEQNGSTMTNEISYISDLYITNGEDIIHNIAAKAVDLIDPSTSYGRPSLAVTTQNVGYLFDGDPATTSDFRNGGNGAGGYITFDFGAGNGLKLTSVDMLARQDGYYGRINGAVVQGSDDNQNWITLSSAALPTTNWQNLNIDLVQKFRYIRLYNSSSWFGNMAEVRFHGTYYGPVDVIETVTLSSEQSDSSGLVKTGETVTLNFEATEQIENVLVNIQGQPANVINPDGFNWTATATLPSHVEPAYIEFNLAYNTASGYTGKPETTTTDASRLYLINSTNLIQNLTQVVDLIDPSTTHGRPDPSITLAMVETLLDADISTVSDFRLGSDGRNSYITFDFKQGNQFAFSALNLLARQDNYFTRINGAIVQGSDDNQTWSDISQSATATQDWQTLTNISLTPYRYIRIYNPNFWWGNMAEIRLHGEMITKGDWDKDNDVDRDDLTAMTRAVARRDAVSTNFDLNNDGVVNLHDVRVMRDLCTRDQCKTQ
ncbi:discoidin domain-containing protein [Catenovulum sp. 2E275]|uniref:discoidin domain-containing protein n=1 Tax=Catenovulum sp. 2E275 TaxID=2980497 RepID=UPI0021D10167|nr:discoidin domain-containing protein [Catenovulum sp. 2E275]MCU4675925.1 discoidin domain-containing protein [Catenovulum sp. 2E275]